MNGKLTHANLISVAHHVLMNVNFVTILLVCDREKLTSSRISWRVMQSAGSMWNMRIARGTSATIISWSATVRLIHAHLGLLGGLASVLTTLALSRRLLTVSWHWATVSLHGKWLSLVFSSTSLLALIWTICILFKSHWRHALKYLLYY